jgi:hypothetical protein
VPWRNPPGRGAGLWTGHRPVLGEATSFRRRCPTGWLWDGCRERPGGSQTGLRFDFWPPVPYTSEMVSSAEGRCSPRKSPADRGLWRGPRPTRSPSDMRCRGGSACTQGAGRNRSAHRGFLQGEGGGCRPLCTEEDRGAVPALFPLRKTGWALSARLPEVRRSLWRSKSEICTGFRGR